MQTWRQQQREYLIEQRQRLNDSQRQSIEKACLATITDHLKTLTPSVLGLYWPIKGEIDCRGLAADLISQGWTITVPVINSETQCLDFAVWQPDTVMVKGTWNIPVPEQQHLLVPDHFLVPLVGFDSHNYRLGYGGGYYDRTLAAISKPVYTIGVGMESGRFETIYPHEFDIAMDKIITEKGIQ